MNLNLLRPCTKEELAYIIRERGYHTIEELNNRTHNLAITYTDGSSDLNPDR
ncbi:hypothetical protein TNCT_406661, partial [Trichonephila clavata]